MRTLLKLLDLPESEQPTFDWREIAEDDPLVPPALFKRLLHELPTPLLQISVYETIRATKTLEE